MVGQFETLAAVAATKSYISSKTITDARATIAANKRWTDRNEMVIDEWLKKNGAAQMVGSVVLLVVLMCVTQWLQTHNWNIISGTYFVLIFLSLYDNVGESIIK